MRKTALFAATLALFASAAGAQTETPSETQPDIQTGRLDGDWMALGDMLGLVPGHIEALHIAEGQAEARLWQGCTAPACEAPMASAEGAVSLEATTVQIDGEGHYPPAPGWEFLQLPGGAWTIIAQGRRLMAMREATVNGHSVPLMRIWLQVTPETPEHLADYFAASGLDPAAALCAVVTLHGDEAAWQGFAAYLSALAAPMNDLRLGQPQADPTVYGAEAVAGLQTLAGWVQGAGLPEGAELLPEILYPVASPMATEIAACRTRLQGG